MGMSAIVLGDSGHGKANPLAAAARARYGASAMARLLAGRTIVITGASSGIGAATALECADEGMNVVLHARRRDRLEAVAERVRAAGRDAEVVVGSVTDDCHPTTLLDLATERFGGFDVVFSNAGYSFEKAAHQLDDDLRDIFEVNFFASHALLSEAARRLIVEKKPGHLLMCSSCVARFPLALHSAYTATKAAQSQVCRAMRVELAPHRIDVSCVYPITTETEFYARSQQRSGLDPPRATAPAHAPKMFVQSPQRVARAIVKCLKRPRSEVWTSFIVRATAAAMTLVPPFTDYVMRSALTKDRRR